MSAMTVAAVPVMASSFSRSPLSSYSAVKSNKGEYFQQQPATATAEDNLSPLQEEIISVLGRNDVAELQSFLTKNPGLPNRDLGGGSQNTAFHYAILSGQLPLVAVMIEHGAELNPCNDMRESATPLVVACDS
jgi:hypothetical protein